MRPRTLEWQLERRLREERYKRVTELYQLQAKVKEYEADCEAEEKKRLQASQEDGMGKLERLQARVNELEAARLKDVEEVRSKIEKLVLEDEEIPVRGDPAETKLLKEVHIKENNARSQADKSDKPEYIYAQGIILKAPMVQVHGE